MRGLVIPLLCLLPAAWAGEAPPVVTTVKVRKVDLVRTVRLPGSVVAWERAAILPHVTGFVRRVAVRQGQWVKRGEVLAEIDVPLMAEDLARLKSRFHAAEAAVTAAGAQVDAARAQVAVRKADLARAQATVDLRSVQLDRLQRLKAEHAATQEQIDNAAGERSIAQAAAAMEQASVVAAEAAAKAAEADRTRAEAGREVARTEEARLEAMAGFAVIRCPYRRGLVTKRLVDPGALVKADKTPLFEVMDVERVRVIVDLNERDAVHVDAGTHVVVTPDALPTAPRETTASRVAQALDPRTRTMRIQIDLENRDHLVRPGMFVHVEVTVLNRPGALTLPAPCLLFSDQEPFVYVVQGGTVEKTPVTTGLDDGIRVEILQGVGEGAEVVTSGQARLRDGIAVRTRPESDR